jgi:hypothetical protein
MKTDKAVHSIALAAVSLCFAIFSFGCKAGALSKVLSSQVVQSVESSSVSSASSAENISYSISSIDFITSKLGYLCLIIYDGDASGGESYRLLKTADGGRTWAAAGDSKQVISTSFIDEQAGYGLLNGQNV